METYISIYKIGSQWVFAIWLMELKPGLCNNLERWDGGRREGGSRGRGTYIYLWLIHVDGWQKPTQFCKATILQLNNKERKKESSSDARINTQAPSWHTRSFFGLGSCQWLHLALNYDFLILPQWPHFQLAAVPRGWSRRPSSSFLSPIDLDWPQIIGVIYLVWLRIIGVTDHSWKCQTGSMGPGLQGCDGDLYNRGKIAVAQNSKRNS